MNFLDWTIIGILLLVVYWGYNTGLVGMAIIAVGSIVGWFLAGQLSEYVTGLIGFEGVSGATATSYKIITALVIISALLIWRVARPVLGMLTLGMTTMVDRMGGAALGMFLGLVITGVLIVGLAVVAYGLPSANALQVDTPMQELPLDELRARIPGDAESRNFARRSLEESAIVGAFIDILEPLHRFVPTGIRSPDIHFLLLLLQLEIQDLAGLLPQQQEEFGTSR